MRMDDFEKMLILFVLFVLLIGVSIGLVVWKIAPPQQFNNSMHNVMDSGQRDVTAGGAGIPGGTDPYLATKPIPLATVKPK